MEIFVYRDQSGLITFDFEDVNELEEHLKKYRLPKMEGNDDIHVEITGNWSEIKTLLSDPLFKGIWFDPKKLPPASD